MFSLHSEKKRKNTLVLKIDFSNLTKGDKMKKTLTVILLIIAMPILTKLLITEFQKLEDKNSLREKFEFGEESDNPIELKKERWEYFFRLMRDPATGEIPKNIRERELEYAKLLKKNMKKHSGTMDLGWKEAGPNDVGGRTRALAIDITNPNIIIAGGVSGGIWKSTDKGATWTIKSTTDQNLSVTSVAQDTRQGHTNTWYYASGEFLGSAQDMGYTHRISGGGIYKSTDNGESWHLLPNAKDTDPTVWNTQYDFVSKIVVSPATGSVFFASHPFGIFKSADGGNSFSLVLGGPNEHIFSDIDVASNGTLVAVLSSPPQGVTPQNSPGVYKSTDDGQTWTNITPTTFPSVHMRSVLKIAPSNNDVVYVLTFTGDYIDQKYDDVRFHKIIISSGVSEDRSANMPNFGYDLEDYIHTQNSYNMVLAVKPDDENFVLIGATSLFRSTNGFSTKPNDVKNDLIGGYHPQEFFYPTFHPDIHSFAFDPTNPNAMWWGNDGGLAYTSDITNTNYDTFFPWENKNNGYNVTQFYMITIPDIAGDDRIMGGTQDNGSPSFRFDGIQTSPSYDVSSGDGAYAYFGKNYPYTEIQNGVVLRVEYDQNGNPVREYPNYSNITPKDATNQLFVNPFVIDPSDENIMIYPAGNVLWRNDQLNSLPNNPSYGEGITTGWTKLDNLSAPGEYVISALAISKSNPAHRLYYGAVDFSQNPSGSPKLYRLDNANTATSGAVDISISGLEPLYYIHNIAVNPDNGDELLVIFSNYNIVGIYHSNNGGQSFTPVEGNLEGTQQSPGPSIRGATILPTSNGTLYLVATSTGVYSTTQLNGNQTVWMLEGPDVIGNVVVNYLASRKSDGRVVAGTHGRGAFMGQASAAGTPVPVVNVQSLTLQSRPGETGSTSFELSNNGNAPMNFNITVTGNFAKTSAGTAVLHKVKRGQKSKGKFCKNFASTDNYSLKPGFIPNKNFGSKCEPGSISGNDVIFLDDGDNSSDSFIGFGDGTDFDWLTEFNLGNFDFQMDSFQFFMRTENAVTNDVYAAIYDASSNLLSEGYLSLSLSQEGDWYTITLNPALNFNAGETFYIELMTSSSYINYPAGADYDAQIPNKCYYYDWTTSQYVNINTISGFENGAFLVRAVGTVGGGGGGNQNPVAVAQVSTTQAEVNESITFDASQSYDNDGQITQYYWEFGDGTTSNEKSTTHAYSQANTYTYSLTVTDDKGATGTTSGQITVTEESNPLVTVQPKSGTIQPGASQTITLTLNAQNLHEGTYVGQVNIATNGGNLTIPIDYLVDIEKIEELPTEFYLSQNYPNPFNPTTVIEYSIPVAEKVNLKIYDFLGREIATLVNKRQSAGKYRVTFTAKNISSGVYFYILKAGEFTDSKKLVLLK